MKTNRIEAFSDGVMAIIITIMVLELKAPHDPTPASLRADVAGLFRLRPELPHHRHLLGEPSPSHSTWSLGSMPASSGQTSICFSGSRLIPWVTCLSRRQSRVAVPGRALCRRLTRGRGFVFLLRALIARHHHDSAFERVNKRMARKNLIAILIYTAAIVSSVHLHPARPHPDRDPGRQCISCPTADLRNWSTRKSTKQRRSDLWPPRHAVACAKAG